MRKQSATRITGKRKRALFMAAAVLLAVGILCAGGKLLFQKAEFVPPEWDASAKTGTPQPEQSLNYGTIEMPTGFSFSLCGTMYQRQDASLFLCFTNPESNHANLRCEIRSTDGTLFYQSGMIRPGEYVETLPAVCKLPAVATPIEICVYAYEPETWYSMGTASLSNTLQPY